MKYRPLNLENDYSVIKRLFEDSPMKVAPMKDQLPINGVVSYDSIDFRGCLFLYLTSNSTNCIVAYPLLSSEIKVNRGEILNKMFKRVEFLAASLGYRTVNTWSGLDHMMDNLIEMDYIEADKNVSHFMKGI